MPDTLVRGFYDAIRKGSTFVLIYSLATPRMIVDQIGETTVTANSEPTLGRITLGTSTPLWDDDSVGLSTRIIRAMDYYCTVKRDNRSKTLIGYVDATLPCHSRTATRTFRD
jgi:hypothetical protein